AADERCETVFEKALRKIVQPPFSVADIPAIDRAAIQRYAHSRQPLWRQGLLRPSIQSAAGQAATDMTVDTPEAVPVKRVDSRAEYQRIRDALLRVVIGQDEVCRRLALAGAA